MAFHWELSNILEHSEPVDEEQSSYNSPRCSDQLGARGGSNIAPGAITGNTAGGPGGIPFP